MVNGDDFKYYMQNLAMFLGKQTTLYWVFLCHWILTDALLSPVFCSFPRQAIEIGIPLPQAVKIFKNTALVLLACFTVGPCHQEILWDTLSSTRSEDPHSREILSRAYEEVITPKNGQVECDQTGFFPFNQWLLSIITCLLNCPFWGVWNLSTRIIFSGLFLKSPALLKLWIN